MKILRPTLLAALAALTFAACTTPRPKKDSAKDAAASAQQAKDEAAAAGLPGDINVEEASLRGKDFQKVEGMATIYFDYDSAALKEAQLEALKKNAVYLKEHPSVEVLVAGFCDDRGTTEYNLALGQKRAKEVREYYIRLGVSGRSVATISYGKESPTCSEQTEECWSANRRAETRLRLRVSDSGKKSSKTAQ